MVRLIRWKGPEYCRHMTTTYSHVPAVANAPPTRTTSARRFRERPQTYTLAAPGIRFVVASPVREAVATKSAEASLGGWGTHWETYRDGGSRRGSILPKQRLWTDGLFPGGY